MKKQTVFFGFNSPKLNRVLASGVLAGLSVVAGSGTAFADIVIKDPSKEVTHSNYSISAKIDALNELGQYPNWDYRTHKSTVTIDIKNPKEIKAGQTITYWVDGFNYINWGAKDVKMPDGTVVGKLQRVDNIKNARSYKSENADGTYLGTIGAKSAADVDWVDDAHAAENNDTSYAITFNDKISQYDTAKLVIDNTGWQCYAWADHDQHPTMTVKDASGNVLDHLEGFSPKDSRDDDTSPITNQSLVDKAQFGVAGRYFDVTKGSSDVSGYFYVKNIDQTNENKVFKAGTELTYTFSDDPNYTLDLTTVKPLLGDKISKDFKVSDTPWVQGGTYEIKNISNPLTTPNAPKTSKGYYYGVNNVINYTVTALSPHSVTIKLNKDVTNVGLEHGEFAVFNMNVQRLDDSTLDVATNRLKVSTKMNVHVTTPDGLSADYTTAMDPHMIGSAVGTDGKFTPKYVTRLIAVDTSGNVLADNMAQTDLQAEGTSYTLTGLDTIKVGDVTYVPQKDKTVTGKTDKTVPTVNLVYVPQHTYTTETKAVKRTIKYVYADTKKSAAKDSVVTVTFKRTVDTDGATGKKSYGKWESDNANFTEVKSPDIAHYVADKASVAQATADPDKGDVTETVTYSAKHTQSTEDKAVTRTIHYVYEDGKKASDDVVQTVTFTRSVDTNEVTNKKEYGKWTNKDNTVDYAEVTSPNIEHYTVDKDVVKNVTAKLEDGNSEETVTYSAKHTQSTEDKAVTRTIHYVYEDGKKASDDVVQTVTFTRSVDTNEATGEVVYGDWTSESNSFEKVDSPSIDDYTADKASVDSVKTSADDTDRSETVTYKANPKPTPVTQVINTVKQVLPTTGDKTTDWLVGVGIIIVAGLGGFFGIKRLKKDAGGQASDSK